MIYNILLLIIGFLILIKGADFFLDGSVSLSKKLKIPSIIIGLTVVAFGTSAPEFFVSIISAIKGSGEIAIGNVIGSNIANVLLILGIGAIILPLKASSKVIVREVPFMFLTAIALWFLCDDLLFSGNEKLMITRGDSLILLLLFSIFLYYLIFDALKSKNEERLEEEYEEIEEVKLIDSKILIFLSIVGGIVFLGLGGNLVVQNAVDIATALGVSKTLAGLTIVAIGTSLPELVTTIIAVRKKETDVAIGNVVGSNVFNTLFVLGASGTITNLSLQKEILADVIIMIFVSALLFFATITEKKITRIEGIFFLTLFIMYMIYIVNRG
jgi:cation:H+ antiporter